MQESKIYKYAFYKIDGRDCYQFLPTSNLDDVIYEDGMVTVEEKKYIRDGNNFIEIQTNNIEATVGEPLYSIDIVKRYYAKDPIFKHCKKEEIASLEKDPYFKWTLYADGNVTFGFRRKYVSINKGKIPKSEIPHDIIKGQEHWYLELLHSNGTTTYEKTVYDDRKYRGQDCEYYTLVKVVEYELNGTKKHVIIERDKNKYPYEEIVHTSLDGIIDQAKGFISNSSTFEGFAGVSPLYTFNTEDSACVFYDNKSKIQGNVVTTVTGSGDAILDLFLYGAKKIISFDANLLTNFYSELKFIAAKNLSFEEFLSFFEDLNKEIYITLESYLSNNTRKFWNELYSYCELVEKPLKNLAKVGLFFPVNILFSSNCTIYNEKGYCIKENYLKLQKILKDKSLDDIYFVNCDIMDLPKVVDLSSSSYIYLSNIMDFIVGVESNIEVEKLQSFKDFILYSLLPVTTENTDIDLCYLKTSWHLSTNYSNYLDVYTLDEGFNIIPLSNKQDNVLSFRSDLLLQNENFESKKL